MISRGCPLYIIVGLAVIQFGWGITVIRQTADYQRSHTSGYQSHNYDSSIQYPYSSSSVSVPSTSTRSSSLYYSTCCSLNNWAFRNLHDLREFANHLRQEFNHLSSGRLNGYGTTYTPWSESIMRLTSKTSGELDALSRLAAEKLVEDMRSGAIAYNTIAQNNFFEWQAMKTLQSCIGSGTVEYDQQRPLNVDQYRSHESHINTHSQPADVRTFSSKPLTGYKKEIETSYSSGSRAYENPYIAIASRNHTNTRYNVAPIYYPSNLEANPEYTSRPQSTVHSTYNYSPSSSSTTVTRKKTVYDWVNENMEPSVINYRPSISANPDHPLSYSQVHKTSSGIPVDTSLQTAVPSYNFVTSDFRPNISPGSTVTLERYNKTIVTKPDGTNLVSGSESHKKWVDGKLVYDMENPFGDRSLPSDEAWKREERERLFWILTPDADLRSLEFWQHKQEDRLLALAHHYHTTIEEIQDWQRSELERYRTLARQYQTPVGDDTAWKGKERGRLDWLIHQNSVTREELNRWQQENRDKLYQLSRQYRIPLEDLTYWQCEELDRLYKLFNEQNNSMLSRPLTTTFDYNSEQERLNELIRRHNATIDQLHNSIRKDQQKLRELSTKYRGSVDDMEKWLHRELEKLTGIINQQRGEVTRITEWQKTERNRLEDIVKQHRGAVGNIDAQIEQDRNYLRTLASKYQVSMQELENWQRSELERLQGEGRKQIELGFAEWQQRERENLKKIIAKNDLTVEEFKNLILNDRQRLENLAQTYKVQVDEIESWLQKELGSLKNEDTLQLVRHELTEWQEKERQRLLSTVHQNEVTVQDLELKIKGDQSHLNELANKYKIEVSEIEKWLKNELQQLQNQGLIKADDLKQWQQNERNMILDLIQQNKLTIDNFEKKLLSDRRRLENLSQTYNVQTHEIESWIKKEGERLQSLGLLQIKEQLNNWQKIEHDRLLALIQQNNFSIKELEDQIKNDHAHLYNVARANQVRVEEIEEWIKQEIKKLQAEGLIELEKLRDWQSEWRGNLTNMVKERDFTVEEFHKWLLEDRARLQALAMQHNVQIEELEQWIKSEEQRFISLGLLKPNEKLTNWQEVERRYLERITQEQYHSTEQLEQRLRQDRELLEQLARDYQIQVEEIEDWMKKELGRLRDQGQLQINNLTAWQIVERERLDELLKQNSHMSAEELKAVLNQDREHIQKIAFQYHTTVEAIEAWMQREIARLQQQGKLNIEKLTAWQRAEQRRILDLLQQQSSITVEEFERKVQQDRAYLTNLARQYHVSVNEIENYVKKVINDLKEKGKFEIEKLKAWQLVERDYIKQLIQQYQGSLTTKEYEEKLLQDRIHLTQLADHYRINVKDIEEWMIQELHRLHKDSADEIQKLKAWQVVELQRLKELILQNQHLNYVQFEVELKKQQERLQQLAQQYSISVEELEQWLKQQLLNLKTTGRIQVENLSKWQEEEQKRIIALCLQQQREITSSEFEEMLKRDRAYLEQIAREHKISIEQIERWMQNEFQRLKNSGLVQVEELSNWQKMERNRLQNWLQQQNRDITVDEFEGFIQRDRQRLTQIARDYHVTVEEIEQWVEQEGARLKLLGLLKGSSTPINNRPSTGKEHTWSTYWSSNTNVNTNAIDDQSRRPANSEHMWKEQTKAHLQAVARIRPMTWTMFEEYLRAEQPRWQQFARQYNISVEQIQDWLRNEARSLIKSDNDRTNVRNGTTLAEWQIVERHFIQNLIKQRDQQQWAYDELEHQLLNDYDHLQRVANTYHLPLEEIESWYREELQRLLDQGAIYVENLTDWQRVQRERIYAQVSQQPGKSIHQWEQYFLSNKPALNRFCDQYHVSMEELQLWIQNELHRLMEAGLINAAATQQSRVSSNWQEVERQRLMGIANELNITEEEFLEFISNDSSFQQQLVNAYGCSLEQLAPFQRIVIDQMNQEGVLDKTKLLPVLYWEKNERDRLYGFIKDKSYTLNDLINWQRQDSFINSLAARYSITAQKLKDWQINEFERLKYLATNYHMTLNQMQDFREKEMRNIAYVMHKNMRSEADRREWEESEARRVAALERKTRLQGQLLNNWRRKYYLLCQGRLPFNFRGAGGSRRNGIPRHIISKDRGDQPPQVHEDNIDADEPEVEGYSHLLPPKV